MSQHPRHVLATRRLREVGAEKRLITVTLGAPQRRSRNWTCAFRITGLEERILESVDGVDAIQSLLLALEAIRVRLDATGRRFSWLGLEGETGFCRVILTPFGPESARRIDRMIDKEIARCARAAKDKYDARFGVTSRGKAGRTRDKPE